jgi:hypothetical protein
MSRTLRLEYAGDLGVVRLSFSLSYDVTYLSDI